MTDNNENLWASEEDKAKCFAEMKELSKETGGIPDFAQQALIASGLFTKEEIDEAHKYGVENDSDA